MNSDQPPSRPPSTVSRQERQAAALRENLHRRKEQARERRQAEPAPPTDPNSDSPPRDGEA
jgi:hypothetical protein